MTEKIAIITGGSRGIGKETVLELAGEGISVIFTYCKQEKTAQEIVDEIERAGGKAVALHLDLTDTASFDKFVKEVVSNLASKWNRSDFDYLVNNGGGAQRTPIAATSEEEFDRIVNEHFKGPFFLTQKLLPLMVDGGHVVNISSALTGKTHSAGVATYAAAKGALEVFTNYIAHEYAARKIRANVIAPGALDTEFGGGRTDAVRQAIAAHTMLGRIGTAKDIAQLISLLLSPKSLWINTQRIEATGGFIL